MFSSACTSWQRLWHQGAWLTGYSPSRMPAVHTPPLAPGYLAAGATISWATLRYDHSPAPPAVSLPRLWCVCVCVCVEVPAYCVVTVERVPQLLPGETSFGVPRLRRRPLTRTVPFNILISRILDLMMQIVGVAWCVNVCV